MPWSVGAIRKTFGRVAASTSDRPPAKTMQIGTPRRSATRHEASTPVPSSTIAIAPSETARRTFATARAGERPVSIVRTVSR